MARRPAQRRHGPRPATQRHRPEPPPSAGAGRWQRGDAADRPQPRHPAPRTARHPAPRADPPVRPRAPVDARRGEPYPPLHPTCGQHRPRRRAWRLPRSDRAPLHTVRRPAPARYRRLAAIRRQAWRARGTQPLHPAQSRQLRAEQPARVRRGEHGVLPPRPQLRLPPPGALPLLRRALRRTGAAHRVPEQLRLPQCRARLWPPAARPARSGTGLLGRLPARRSQ
ncbi:hypothetical protein D9M71_360390 [compost metagenome]